VELTRNDPCRTEKAVQQFDEVPNVGPNPRLDVLKVLPFTARKRGPLSARKVGAFAEGDRLTATRAPPEVT